MIKLLKTRCIQLGLTRTLSNTHLPSPLEWSYICGPSVAPLRDLTIGKLIDRAARKFGDREAVVSMHQDRLRKTFAEVKTDVDRLSAGFVAMGLKLGDRIGIWGPNSYEWYTTHYAAGKAGLILVNINPAYRPGELLYCLRKVGINALVSSERFKGQDYYEMLTSVVPEVANAQPGKIQSEAAPDLKHVIMMTEKDINGVFKYDDVLRNFGGSNDLKRVEELIHIVQSDDPCNIQFTSGTTGNPKGATLTHHNVVNNGQFVGQRLGYGLKPHSICCSVPLFHCFGCVVGSLATVFFGGKMVFPAPHFDAQASLDAIQLEKCTSVYGTPTMFVDMLNLSDNSNPDLSSIETGVMAGSPCPKELCKDVINKMNMKDFVVAYGLTEISPVCTLSFPDDNPDLKCSSVGYPLDHLELKVIDGESRTVKSGESGELCTRGYSTFIGYWDDEEKTKEAVTPDKWFHTGDLAVMYPNGYVQIVGRIKDMVIRGGENIYPREIEEILHGHPDILEAHAFGVPDKRLGEEVCAWIRVSRDDFDPSEVKSFLKGKVAHFKIPRYVKIVDDFPKTVTGKIQKFKMREESIKHFKIE